jgi:phage tail sheath protein FI
MPTTYPSPGVYVEEVEKGSRPIEGVGTAVAAFIGFAEQGPLQVPKQIANWTQFTQTFGGFVAGGYLAHTVYGYFNNGGGLCYVTRLPGEIRNGRLPSPQSDGNGRPRPARAMLPSRASPDQPTLELSTLEHAGNAEVSAEVQPGEPGGPEEQFTLIVRGDGIPENFPNVTLARGKGARNVVDVLSRESRLVRAVDKEAPGSPAERAPAIGTYTLIRTGAELAEASREPAMPEVKAFTFIGNASTHEGILGYEIADDVTMLCVPDLMAAYQAGTIDADGLRIVQTAMINHCESMHDRVAILDTPPDLSPQQVGDWCTKVANYDSNYTTLYYPWIRVADPTSGKGVLVPPCGHIAGIWARSDSQRGVHKAPANEVVRGAIGLATDMSRSEQGSLNPIGINCIRAFPGRGVRVWGARMLSRDPEWRYLNVRRLFNFIEKSIDRDTQWVVFEPNNFYTWEKVKRDVTAFLTRVWRDGALFGASAAEAFYVKCDEELNPVEVRDVGQLIVEVGIAPVKPAEFVIFRISQYAAEPA